MPASAVTQLVADNNSSGSSNTHRNTITADVDHGDDIVVIVAQQSVDDIFIASVTDSQSNTYALNVESTVAGNKRIGIFSGRCGTALVGGVDWIQYKVAFTNATNVAVYAAKMNAMHASSPTFDVGFGEVTGTSTAPDTGSTAATTYADEVLWSAHGYENAPVYTPTAGFAPTAATNVHTATFAVAPTYKVVHAIGVQRHLASLDSSQAWGGCIATYRSAVFVNTDVPFPHPLAVGMIGTGITR